MISKLIPINIDKLKETAKKRPQTEVIRRARRKLAVLKRDEFKCVNCGSSEDLTVDHFGRVVRKNQRNAVAYNPNVCKTLCVECHEEKNRLMKGVKYRRHERS